MIASDNIEATSVIRPAIVMQAREAVARGAYDAPRVLDAAIDKLLDSIVDQNIEAAAESAFWTDYED